MQTVRAWLVDWVSMNSEHNLQALGVTELLDAEVGSAAEAVTLLNNRIDLMQVWMNGVRPRLPVHEVLMTLPERFQVGDPATTMCRGAGPAACKKANTCLRHNACMYMGSKPVRPT